MRAVDGLANILVRHKGPVIVISAVLGFVAWFAFKEFSAIQSQPVTSWVHEDRADCAVVLTGGPNRVREGFDLLAQGLIKKLIISGVHPKATLRSIFPPLPFHNSINESDVILEKHSTTTYGNAQQTLALVEAVRCRDLMLITSQVHMRRALKTFRASSPAAFPIVAHAVPAGRSESSIDEVLLETIKSLFYSIWAY